LPVTKSDDQADIEPATAAGDNVTLGSAKAGQSASTHLHPRMRRPSGGLRQLRRTKTRDGRG
jgi:hypothetical protein